MSWTVQVQTEIKINLSLKNYRFFELFESVNK